MANPVIHLKIDSVWFRGFVVVVVVVCCLLLLFFD